MLVKINKSLCDQFRDLPGDDGVINCQALRLERLHFLPICLGEKTNKTDEHLWQSSTKSLDKDKLRQFAISLIIFLCYSVILKSENMIR